jgi:DNA-binding transcriptional MerR regulator
MGSAFRIGEAASRAGVSVDTIRYYEKLKLLPRAPRSEGGFRLFTADTIERVRFIKKAQEIGFSLKEIKQLLVGGGANECRRVRDMLQLKIAEIDTRVKALREFRRTLTRHLNACEEEIANSSAATKCPVIVKMTNTAKGKRQRG